MANVYVRSGAVGAGTGVDKTNAYTTMAAAATASAAGDVFWVASDHAETQASAMTITFPGTLTSPNRCFCVDFAGSTPPVAADLRTTATISTTGASALIVNGSVYGYGIIFSAGNGANAVSLTFINAATARQKWESCDFILGGTTGGNITLGIGITSSDLELLNWRFKVASTSSRLALRQRVRSSGGSVISGGSSPTVVFSLSSAGFTVDGVFSGFDFSNLAAATNLVTGGANTSAGKMILQGCLPPSTGHTLPWSGSLLSAALTTAGLRVEMTGTDPADTDVMYHETTSDYAGTVSDETTTFVRAAGASIPNSVSGGISPIPFALKFAPSALCAYPLSPLRSVAIEVYDLVSGAASVGVAMTLTAHVLFNQVAEINDNDFWMEVSYPGTGGKTTYLAVSSLPTTLLTAATDLQTKFGAGAGWTTSGMANPKQRKVACTFTPQEKGVILVRLCMGNTVPTTVYADPLIVRS